MMKQPVPESPRESVAQATCPECDGTHGYDPIHCSGNQPLPRWRVESAWDADNNEYIGIKDQDGCHVGTIFSKSLANLIVNLYNCRSVAAQPSPATPKTLDVERAEKWLIDHPTILAYASGRTSCYGLAGVLHDYSLSCLPPTAPQETAEEAWKRGFIAGVDAESDSSSSSSTEEDFIIYGKSIIPPYVAPKEKP